MKKTRAEQIAAWTAEHHAENAAQAAKGRALIAAMSAAAARYGIADPCVFITCGHCAQVAPAEAWTRREIGGNLPPTEYQCPACNRAFRRIAPADPRRNVHLDPIPARL